jgi:hypothetical protein
MSTVLLIVMAIGELMGGMGLGVLLRDWQNSVWYKQYEHKIVYTIDMSLIKPDEGIDDFINRAHDENLGTYIMK